MSIPDCLAVGRIREPESPLDRRAYRSVGRI